MAIIELGPKDWFEKMMRPQCISMEIINEFEICCEEIEMTNYFNEFIEQNVIVEQNIFLCTL